MREVKFRGKRKLNGEWVYGSLIQIGNDWCQIIPTGTEYDEIKNEMYRVISDTIGEWSGLQDEKKKDIYEGDIMDYGWAKKPVAFVYGSFGVVNQHPDGGISVGTYQISNGVVIGNIYENPELVNKKQLVNQ